MVGGKKETMGNVAGEAGDLGKVMTVSGRL